MKTLALLNLISIHYGAQLMGVVIPWVVAAIQRPTFRPWARMAITLAVCMLSSVMYTIGQGVPTADNIVATFLTTVVTAMLLYQHVYKLIGIGKWEEISSSIWPATPAASKEAGQVVPAIEEGAKDAKL